MRAAAQRARRPQRATWRVASSGGSQVDDCDTTTRRSDSVGRHQRTRGVRMTSVLIVDDDAAFRTATARDLSEQGFAVSIADSADQAIQILSDSAIDVVLSDLRMPGT